MPFGQSERAPALAIRKSNRALGNGSTVLGYLRDRMNRTKRFDIRPWEFSGDLATVIGYTHPRLLGGPAATTPRWWRP